MLTNWKIAEQAMLRGNNICCDEWESKTAFIFFKRDVGFWVTSDGGRYCPNFDEGIWNVWQEPKGYKCALCLDTGQVRTFIGMEDCNVCQKKYEAKDCELYIGGEKICAVTDFKITFDKPKTKMYWAPVYRIGGSIHASKELYSDRNESTEGYDDVIG